MLMDKLPDAANLSLGALVFGQLLGDKPFSLGLAALGIGGWVTLLGWGFFLGGEERT